MKCTCDGGEGHICDGNRGHNAQDCPENCPVHRKTKLSLVEEFDELISGAPLDFMGTGCLKYAELVENDWNEQVKLFRNELEKLEKQSQIWKIYYETLRNRPEKSVDSKN